MCLRSVTGIQEFEIDANRQMVEVVGQFDPEKAMKSLKKIRKNVTIEESREAISHAPDPTPILQAPESPGAPTPSDLPPSSSSDAANSSSDLQIKVSEFAESSRDPVSELKLENQVSEISASTTIQTEDDPSAPETFDPHRQNPIAESRI
ncbi:hypothetical protein Nepgr_022296 [Nepenthes gracilis]|uniref:HMA domain-containing protein n=1 Tax=Nepenthes gracilis TaxID=150966 RepID=A0AAD3T0H4_NEPGR|nr:hypothetical protein Nepgr_022296 [Nepenthes gracilis]